MHCTGYARPIGERRVHTRLTLNLTANSVAHTSIYIDHLRTHRVHMAKRIKVPSLIQSCPRCRPTIQMRQSKQVAVTHDHEAATTSHSVPRIVLRSENQRNCATINRPYGIAHLEVMARYCGEVASPKDVFVLAERLKLSAELL